MISIKKCNFDNELELIDITNTYIDKETTIQDSEKPDFGGEISFDTWNDLKINLLLEDRTISFKSLIMDYCKHWLHRETRHIDNNKPHSIIPMYRDELSDSNIYKYFGKYYYAETYKDKETSKELVDIILIADCKIDINDKILEYDRLNNKANLSILTEQQDSSILYTDKDRIYCLKLYDKPYEVKPQQTYHRPDEWYQQLDKRVIAITLDISKLIFDQLMYEMVGVLGEL
jgi:hypothetical protein